MSQTVTFFVQGKPASQGSKRAIYSPKANRSFVIEDCKRNKPWRSDVRDAAQKAWPFPPHAGPVRLVLRFYFMRPRSHYGSGRNADLLKASAPEHMLTKPDMVKLARAVEDAMKGLVWHDDSQVIEELISKHYTGSTSIEGCGVEITMVEAK